MRPVDLCPGKEAGLLFGGAGRGIAVDGMVVALAGVEDRVVSSGPDDIRALVGVSGRAILVVPC